jgi:hypothetical protein
MITEVIGVLKVFRFQISAIHEHRSIVTCLDGLQGKVDALKWLQIRNDCRTRRASALFILDKAFKGER